MSDPYLYTQCYHLGVNHFYIVILYIEVETCVIKFLLGKKATESLGPEMREWVAAERLKAHKDTRRRLLFYVVKSSDDRWERGDA